VLEAVADIPAIASRVVELSRRRRSTKPAEQRKHPERPERTAMLNIGATTVKIQRPHMVTASVAAAVDVNVVHVWEESPPEGHVPVTWTLFTTEPIATAKDVLRVVDIYRTRWLIEEFFKALKTGCAYEDRQLESRHALETALGLFIPLALQMLATRSLARHRPDLPAETVASPLRLRVLRELSPRRLPAKMTVRQFMYAVAGLAGHIERSGEPGWQKLMEGFMELFRGEKVWQAAVRYAEQTRGTLG
jgi:hypothetical protein